MKRSQIVGLAVFGSVCILLGNKTAGAPPPDIVSVTHTKVVHDPGETKTITVETPLNEHCIRAMKAVSKVIDQADKLYANGDAQLNILADARRRLAAGKDTTPVDAEQRRLQGHEVGALRLMGDLETRIKVERKLCEENR